MLEEEIMAQIESVQQQLLVAPPGSPQAIALQSQLLVLQNELAEEPIIPPIFRPGPFGPGPFGPRPGPHR
jgi:hypothetical protein